MKIFPLNTRSLPRSILDLLMLEYYLVEDKLEKSTQVSFVQLSVDTFAIPIMERMFGKRRRHERFDMLHISFSSQPEACSSYMKLRSLAACIRSLLSSFFSCFKISHK